MQLRTLTSTWSWNAIRITTVFHRGQPRGSFIALHTHSSGWNRRTSLTFWRLALLMRLLYANRSRARFCGSARLMNFITRPHHSLRRPRAYEGADWVVRVVRRRERGERERPSPSLPERSVALGWKSDVCRKIGNVLEGHDDPDRRPREP